MVVKKDIKKDINRRLLHNESYWQEQISKWNSNIQHSNTVSIINFDALLLPCQLF